ncbi:hypothetical protein WJX82_006898 [Trebouxia sp. C0006]
MQAICLWPAGTYTNVQGLVCHMHNGTPRTVLDTSLNATNASGMLPISRHSSLGSDNQILPGALNTLAGGARMAVEVYRMYMHERLLIQLDWGACQGLPLPAPRTPPLQCP